MVPFGAGYKLNRREPVMRMQNSYDIAKARKREGEIEVARYVAKDKTDRQPGLIQGAVWKARTGSGWWMVSGVTLDSPPGAASELARTKLNGWLYWKVRRSGESEWKLLIDPRLELKPYLGSHISERVMNLLPRPLSSENIPPRPSTTSMIRRVCFQASN